MPNRIVREGFLDSETVDRLSIEAERFYFRLLLVADDYGRFDGRLQILLVRLFPLKPQITIKNIEDWLKECTDSELVYLYSVKNKEYLQIKKYNQRLRAKKSRYPEPDDSHVTGTCQSDDGHMTSTLSESEYEKKRNESESQHRASGPDLRPDGPPYKNDIARKCQDIANGLAGEE